MTLGEGGGVLGKQRRTCQLSSVRQFSMLCVFHILCVKAIDHFVVTCDCSPSQNTRSEKVIVFFVCVRVRLFIDAIRAEALI